MSEEEVEKAPPPFKRSGGSIKHQVGDVGTRMKNRNFTTDEDIFLSMAFVNASTSPVLGNDQKADDFWRHVKENFQTLCSSKGLSHSSTRDASSLRNRFKRHIQREVNIWNGYFKRIKAKNQSGKTEADLVDDATKEYLLSEGKNFRFAGCIPALHQMPKFNPMVDDDSLGITDDDANVANPIKAPMGSKLPRPIGAKAAKQKMKEERSFATQESLSATAMAELTGATKDLAKAVSKKADVDAKKAEVQALMRMAELYNSMGDMETALKKIKEAEEMQKKPMPTSTTPESAINSSVPSNIDVGASSQSSSSTPLHLFTNKE